jgi:hypothetical protein
MVNRLYIVCIGLSIAFAIMLSLGGSTVNAAERSSANFNIETDILSNGGATGESANFKMENSSLGETFQAGSMESANFAVYGEFQETLGTSPEIIGGTMQYLRDNITMIATGEWIIDDTVVFRFTMSDPDPSNFLMAQVEVRSTEDAFTGVPNYSGLEVPYAGGLVTGIVTASGISDDTAYHWQARVIDDENRYSPWMSFGNNAETAIDFGIDQTPDMFPTSLLTAEALAKAAPTYVRLYWLASTSEGEEGYFIYRGTAYGVYDPTPLNGTLVTGLTYDDNTVAPYVNYHYAVETYSHGWFSPYSNDATAPRMKITSFATVESPQAGGYTGGKYDPVPGSTIKYTVRYENIGFGLAVNTILNEKIPTYTEYKMGGATGEDHKTIRYSSNNGASYTYTPTGSLVDPLVTNISWEVNDINAGYGKVATFEVIIK